ncbi:hypothetical protein BS17DRAFT_787705, partial [Gyrodon lividus]
MDCTAASHDSPRKQVHILQRRISTLSKVNHPPRTLHVSLTPFALSKDLFPPTGMRMVLFPQEAFDDKKCRRLSRLWYGLRRRSVAKDSSAFTLCKGVEHLDSIASSKAQRPENDQNPSGYNPLSAPNKGLRIDRCCI